MYIVAVLLSWVNLGYKFRFERCIHQRPHHQPSVPLVGLHRPHPRWEVLTSIREQCIQWVLPHHHHRQVVTHQGPMVMQGLCWDRWQLLQFRWCRINPNQNRQIVIGHQIKLGQRHFISCQIILMCEHISHKRKSQQMSRIFLLQSCLATKDGLVPLLPMPMPVFVQEGPVLPVEPVWISTVCGQPHRIARWLPLILSTSTSGMTESWGPWRMRKSQSLTKIILQLSLRGG